MKKSIVFFLLIVLLTSCSKVLITGRKQLLLIPDSEILAMSSESYRQYLDSVPLSTDKTNTALVKKVGKNISTAVENYLRANGLASEITNFSWEFNLVKDPSKNAFCMPGGKVVVYEGILPVTKTEAGLAVVMGHEIAHAVAKHSSERLSQEMLAQFGSQLTDLLITNKSAVTKAGIDALYGLGVQVGVLLPYSRKQEYEADRLGLIFLAMAGYDPNEAISFWERMSAESTNTIEFLSTHPSDAKRLAKMKEYLPEAMKYYKK